MRSKRFTGTADEGLPERLRLLLGHSLEEAANVPAPGRHRPTIVPEGTPMVAVFLLVNAIVAVVGLAHVLCQHGSFAAAADALYLAQRRTRGRRAP